jgi:cell division GTPase FtsZ
MNNIQSTNKNNKIKVIRIGSNLTNYTVEKKLKNIEFIVIDTNKQTVIDDKFKKNLEKTGLAFIILETNSKTDIEVAQLIAKTSKEIGALTIAIITNLLKKENNEVIKSPKEINSLQKECNKIIITPNKTDTKGYNISEQVVNLIINTFTDEDNKIIDFDDLKYLMNNREEIAIVGIGYKSGKNSAYEALTEAIKSPLFDNIDIMNVKGLFISLTTNENYPLIDADEAFESVLGGLIDNKNVTILIDEFYDNSFADDEIKVMIIATEFKN